MAEETLTLDVGDNKKRGGGEEEEPNTNVADSSTSSSPVETLERASELFNKGSKSIEDGDAVDAVDCLSRALEIRVAHYGELAPECALSYYKYGCALLYKSQEEADPLVNVPKNDPKNLEKDKSQKNVGDGESSKASASNAKEYSGSGNNEEAEDGATDKDQENDNEGSDSDDEELVEADEDDSDLDLAWKMLDVARAIVEKSPEDKIEKVNILSALGEVSMEREDFETSLNDYQKALSILERLVGPDNRWIVELNFRICLVLEVWSKVEEAIPYCQKAISLCKSRLKRLNEDVKPTALPGNVDPVNDSGGNLASGKGDADPSIQEDEKEVLGGILSELERKLEDLLHVMSNPKNSIFTEIMKMVASSKSASLGTSMPSTESRSASLNSSNMGVVNANTNGGGFDSPTISTAATNGGGGGGGVTHLGVVGRGVKRASLNPIAAAEPSSKRLALDSSSSVEKDGSSISQPVNSSASSSVQNAVSPAKN